MPERFVPRLLRSCLRVVAATALASAATAASAAPITYTMTWYGASGSLGGTAFSNETLVFRLTTDTSNVVAPGAGNNDSAEVLFINGAGITVSLGTGVGALLDNATLANEAVNSSSVYALGSGITLRRTPLGSPNQNRGELTFASDPSPAHLTAQQRAAWKLSNDWNMAASGFLFGALIENTFKMSNGDRLSFTQGATSGGYWGIAPSAVPGTGLAAIGTLGLAGLAGRRRR